MRIKEGMKARFEAIFAGNPRPDVTWHFNGEQLENSQNVQIKVKDMKTTLTLIDCTMASNGYYTCKASSELGVDTTRAGLTVSSMLHIILWTCSTRLTPCFINRSRCVRSGGET